jgi:hypothetical protein
MDDKAALIAEQMAHTLDLLKAEIDGLRTRLEHNDELARRRLDGLEKTAADQETRLRAASDGVTQFKVISSLASGGSSILSVAAMVKAFFGM